MGRGDGFSLMIGGDRDTVYELQPIFETLSQPSGWFHFGSDGAKMEPAGRLGQGFKNGLQLVDGVAVAADHEREAIAAAHDAAGGANVDELDTMLDRKSVVEGRCV